MAGKASESPRFGYMETVRTACGSNSQRCSHQKTDRYIGQASKADWCAICRTENDCAQDLYVAQGIGRPSSRCDTCCDAIMEVLPFTTKRLVERGNDCIVRVRRAIHLLHAHICRS